MKFHILYYRVRLSIMEIQKTHLFVFLLISFVFQSCKDGKIKVTREELSLQGLSSSYMISEAENLVLDVNTQNGTDSLSEVNIWYECYFDTTVDGRVASLNLCTSIVDSFNRNTGAMSWTPSYTSAGVYEFSIIGHFNSEVKKNIFTITVNDVVLDVAPVATNNSLNKLFKDKEGVIQLSYTDSDSDLATACTVSNLVNITLTSSCTCDSAGNYSGPLNS